VPTVRQRGGSSGQTIAFGVPLAEGVLRLDGMQPHKHKHLVASESAEIDQIQSISRALNCCFWNRPGTSCAMNGWPRW